MQACCRIWFRVLQTESREIDRVSSPDQLDQLIQITSPLDWLAVAATLIALTVLLGWGFFGSVPQTVDGMGVLLYDRPLGSVDAVASGQVVEMRVRVGDIVTEGTIIGFVQPTQSYPAVSRVELVSDKAGRVTHVRAKRGDIVNSGAPLLELAPMHARLICLSYIPLTRGKPIEAGLHARVMPNSTHESDYGSMKGIIEKVSDSVSTVVDIKSNVGSEGLATILAGKSATVRAVVIRLVEDPSTASGYKWSTPAGPPFKIPVNTVCKVQLIQETRRPVELVVPELMESLGGGNTGAGGGSAK